MPEIIQEEVEDRLWSEIDKGRIGMLGLAALPMRFEPMTAFAERADAQLWFFSYRDDEIAKLAADGAEAAFVIQSRDQDLQGCIRGRLIEDRDPQRIDRYWGAWMEATFPDGKDDQRLTLLRLEGRDAQVWLTEAGQERYAWELGGAGMAGERPDLGDHWRKDLH
jgi:general stress protein 26